MLIEDDGPGPATEAGQLTSPPSPPFGGNLYIGVPAVAGVGTQRVMSLLVAALRATGAVTVHRVVPDYDSSPASAGLRPLPHAALVARIKLESKGAADACVLEVTVMEVPLASRSGTFDFSHVISVMHDRQDESRSVSGAVVGMLYCQLRRELWRLGSFPMPSSNTYFCLWQSMDRDASRPLKPIYTVPDLDDFEAYELRAGKD